jgi:excisionase family DNA binding protein
MAVTAPDQEGLPLSGVDRYTMNEAARIKGVSYHTVSRAVRQGRLPVLRLGRMALISSSDLESWHPMRERAPRKYRQEPEPLDSSASLIRGDRFGDQVGLARHLSSLIEVFHAASAGMPLEDFGSVVAQQFARAFDLERVSVWATDNAARKGHRIGTYGGRLSASPDSVGIDGGYERLFSMIERGKARVSPDPAQEFRMSPAGGPPIPIGPTLIVPLCIEEHVVGVIWADRKGERLAMSQDQLALAQVLGDQAALALEHAMLRKSEAFRIAMLSTILDQFDVQVRACDTEGRLRLINRADLKSAIGAEDQPKLGDDALVNRSIVSRHELDGTEIPLDRHPLARALDGESVDDWEYLATMADGREVRFNVSARPLIIDDSIAGGVYIARDITAERERERRNQERIARIERVQKRAATFSELVAAVSATDSVVDAARFSLETAIKELDGVGGIAFRMMEGEGLTPRVQSGAAEALELEPIDDPIANSTTILAFSRRSPVVVSREEAGRAEQDVMDAIGANELVVAPIQTAQQRLGALHVYRESGEPLTEDDLTLASDIGRQCALAQERLLLLRALDTAQSRLDAVMDQIQDAVIVIDAGRRVILAANSAASDLWGIPIVAGITRPGTLPAENGSGRGFIAAQHPLVRALKGTDRVTTEAFTVVDQDGERKEVNLTAIQTCDEDGTVNGCVCILSDPLRLSFFDQLKGQFLSRAVEELAQPMHSVRTDLQRIRRGLHRQASTGGPAVDPVEVDHAMDRFDQLAGLIGGLLDMSRADLGVLHIQPRRTDASLIIQSAVETISGRNQDRVIRISAPQSLPVVWDQERIEQVLRMLLENAIRYGGDHPVEVDGSTDGESVTVTVRDYGPGIPESVRQHLFEHAFPFEGTGRGRTSNGNGEHGLGLGLYLGARLAESHGGSLTAHNAEDGGAVLVLNLPAVVRVD